MHAIKIKIFGAAVAAAFPAWGQAMNMPGMDMPMRAASAPAPSMPETDMHGMSMPSAGAPAPVDARKAPAPSLSVPGMTMQGMGATAAPGASPAKPDSQKGMAEMPGMGSPASAAAVNPRSADADFGGYTLTTGPYIPSGVKPPRLADQENFGSVLVDRLERAYGHDASNWTAYDVQAWFGRDFNRLVFKAEGQASQGRVLDARTELLWGHAIAPYWDLQTGVRHDNGGGPDRNWLAFGVQGIAPYWFDIEATAYVGDQGRSALRLASSYELLLTQRWVLQPRAEVNVYGKDDPERSLGSGLSDATAGLRLRYEFSRQFAPYIGVEWRRRFGRTADLARAAGERKSATDVVAGLHFWF